MTQSLRFRTLLAAFAILIFSLISISGFAMQISKAQIEQFKKLPPDQQKTLAKSMGIDYKARKAQLSRDVSPPAPRSCALQVVGVTETEDVDRELHVVSGNLEAIERLHSLPFF